MIRTLINKIFSLFGMRIISNKNYKTLSKLPRSIYVYALLSLKEKTKVNKYLSSSKSQLAQDIFVIAKSKNIDNKFFVEFGATDGITNSNTYILEKELDWNGILIEPAKIWHENLFKNRNCIIDTRCIYPKSGEKLPFLIVENNGEAEPGLSTLKKFANNGDWASKIRTKNSSEHYVETINLNELLDFYEAPKEIEYMSIDTEGSEYDILNNFNFSSRKIKIITVEHNYHNEQRNKIYSLLIGKGYKRIFENVSQFDDWYLLEK